MGAVFLTGMFIPVKAQQGGVLYGRVLSAGQPVAGITVLIKNTMSATRTDQEGNYSLSGIGKDSDALMVNGLGCETLEKQILWGNMDTLRLDITLYPYRQVLDEVTVMGRLHQSYVKNYSFIGTKTAIPVIDVPQTVSIVTKELMEDQQAFLTTDVVGALAGVNVASGYDDFTIRGFKSGFESGFRLVNGLRSGYGYGTSYFRVPLTINLESIEVLKGPGASLFGDISPGGTVNLVTKKPLPEVRKAIRFSVGSFNTMRGSMDFTGPLDSENKLLYRLNIGGEQSDTHRDVNQRSTILVAPSFTFLPSENTRVNVEMVYGNFDGYLDRGMGIRASDLYALPRSFTLSQPSDFFKVRDFSFTTTIYHHISPNFTLHASYLKFIYNENLEEHRTLNTFADAPANTIMNMRFMSKTLSEYTDNTTAYLAWVKTYEKVSTNLVVGADYIRFRSDDQSHQWEARSIDVDGEAIPLTFDLHNMVYQLRNTSNYIRRAEAPFPFMDPYNTLGIYVQNHVHVGERLKVLLGVRYESFFSNFAQQEENANENRQGAWLPRLGITYTLSDKLNYYLSYTQGFIPIRPMYMARPEDYGQADPFRPEYSYQVETGLKATFFDGQLYANMSIFHIERQNMLVNTGMLNDEGIAVYNQNGRVKSQGLELELVGRLRENLQVSANYTFNPTQVVQSENSLEEGQGLGNAPRNLAGLWLKYRFTHPAIRHWGIGLGGQHVGVRRMDNMTVISAMGERGWEFWPQYTIANAAIYYRRGSFNAALNMDNLFDSYYFLGGFDYTRAFPGRPRSLMLAIGYSF